MNAVIEAIVALVGAYSVGSIPSGFLIARLCGVADIRQHGSGNIGATNVARVLGKKFFCLVLLLDAGKAYGYVALLSVLGVSYNLVCLAALGLLLGNSASLFLRFSGGKGVATTVGALAFLAPLQVIVALIVWLLVLATVRIVGVASIAAALSVVVFALYSWHVTHSGCALVGLIMALWIVALHRKNIQAYIKNS